MRTTLASEVCTCTLFCERIGGAFVSRNFGEQIADGRKAAGRSLRDLAASLELSPSYLNDIEHGRRVPSAGVIADLAQELNLDADALLAAAGRVGDNAEEYLKLNPNAGVLLRTVSKANLSNNDLQQLIQNAERLIEKRDREP